MIKSKYSAPVSGTYRCSKCGAIVEVDPDKTYEDQAACPEEECLGQVFCNEWNGWGLSEPSNYVGQAGGVNENNQAVV